MTDPDILTFVTSLRHIDTTADYSQVEALLHTTLRSLDTQTDRRCRVIVVANTQYTPPHDIRLPVEVIQVDFPAPPGWNGTTQELHNAVRVDKGAKLAVALSRIPGGHVMPVDADDFVNRRMVEFAAAHRDAPGWYIENGLAYDVARGLYRHLPRFNTICGTSLIYARSLFPLIDIPSGASRDEVIALYGHDRVLFELGSHRHLHERHGLPPVPFRGAVYCLNNGQNTSSKSLINLGRPLTSALASEFGISRHRPTEMWAAAAAGIAPGLRRLAANTASGGFRGVRGVIAD